MGTWGFNILDDDAARDVHGDYLKHFNAERGPAEIMERLRESYGSTIDDDDDGPVFWIAVAKAQWDCGHLEASVRDRVVTDIEQGRGLERWKEEGSKVLAKRVAKLRAFVAELQRPNPKPRRPRPVIKRKPVFEAGDCVAVRLSDGDYGAVLVLAAGDPHRGPDEETYGSNVVGLLKYKSREKPGLDVFEKREWLWLTHHNWINDQFQTRKPGDPPGQREITSVTRSGFRAVKDRFEVVGRVALRESDPIRPDSYSGWDFVEQVVYQDRWDRGIRG